ncbi:LysR substrate-binding domain-containing protein [Azospirillum soli]|uniref:LysR substrate-binding domain-containing protein n=1 Tax=Azospirillum soli TaxID=1304799 RepID=UPI001AE7BE9B|nr:LysR substrate-binding domain-containing protein [Azospirillum soli]MBP2315701.1 DNA-binding transcriptional LysR family regulator [Azospirillum soli]
MRLSNIDTQLLRSFITINDVGGFAKAADILHMTQPAISQQMRRLEEMLGLPLFRRHGRLMRLTNHGETLLGYARRIVALNDEAVRHMGGMKRTRETVTLGITEHFLDAFLHQIIAESARRLPEIRLIVRTGTSQRLMNGMEQGEIDLALTLGEAGGTDASTLQTIPITWVSGTDYRFDSSDAVQLVVFSGQCMFRRLIINALEAANRVWHISYESDDLAGLRAAVRANLGVTALPAQQLPTYMQALAVPAELPALPVGELSLRYRPAWSSPAVQDVGGLIADLWGHPPASGAHTV